MRNSIFGAFRLGRPLAIFSLALFASNAGCEGELFDVIDDVLDNGCSKQGDCDGGTTGIPGTTTGSDASSSLPEGCHSKSGDTSSTASDHSHSGEQKECTPGETRELECGKCGVKPQTCGYEGWVDSGECSGEGICVPGELFINDHFGRFECGTHKHILRCDDQCRPSIEIGVALVSRCSPTDCCGSAPGARVACLDPENIPVGGFCRTSAPSEDSIGKTWFTPESWVEYLKALEEG